MVGHSAPPQSGDWDVTDGGGGGGGGGGVGVGVVDGGDEQLAKTITHAAAQRDIPMLGVYAGRERTVAADARAATPDCHLGSGRRASCNAACARNPARMVTEVSRATRHPASLTEFIKANRTEIISVWADTVRALPVARDLERPVLVDHIPDLLDHICEMTEQVGAGREPVSPWDIAELHARERLEEGFDLGQIVAEYRTLRASAALVRTDPGLLTRTDPPNGSGSRT